MAKTYLPTLRALVTALCVYMTRYQDTIRANLAGAALLAFEGLIIACNEFLGAIGEKPINP
jgi:hypothetical protein